MKGKSPGYRLYGCTDWRKAMDMAGKERETFLRTLYQNQLETAVGAKYVRFFTMKDGKNKTIYDLFFATNHPSGIDAMKGAMWKVDQTGGGYTFSDATDPDQETLSKPSQTGINCSTCCCSSAVPSSRGRKWKKRFAAHRFESCATI
jgi:hypothetical protein